MARWQVEVYEMPVDIRTRGPWGPAPRA